MNDHGRIEMFSNLKKQIEIPMDSADNYKSIFFIL